MVVDYKTDAWRTEGELEVKVQTYTVQLQAYADAIREAVGRPVDGALLLFLRRGFAVARAVNIVPSGQ